MGTCTRSLVLVARLTERPLRPRSVSHYRNRACVIPYNLAEFPHATLPQLVRSGSLPHRAESMAERPAS